VLLSRFFPSRRSGSPASASSRAYAIGDIHGRLDLLDEMLTRVESDSAGSNAARVTMVFLGDLIDRGPQSAQVVERLRRYHPPFAQTVFLMGNHEEVFLRVLGGDLAVLPDWLRFGGAECLQSYGVDPTELTLRKPADVLRTLREAIPKDHVKFLSGFADTASFGRYLFVHAGIRPGVPLPQQVPEDLRWIRQPFLDDETDHGHVVVHGHTISREVDIRPNRIGLDTGAYHSGVLSALGVEGDERWIIQAGIGQERRDGSVRVAKYQHA